MPDHGSVVCWTRMDANAGQNLSRIIRRKEMERRAGSGIFYWGVGNAPATSIAEMAKSGAVVPLIFSTMRSNPRPVGTSPDKVVAWRRFVDWSGNIQPLPPNVLVTSSASSRSHHYALVCHSSTALTLGTHGFFYPGAHRNIGGKQRPPGASQVTALVRKVGEDTGTHYEISLKATLQNGLWVKLVDPILLSEADRDQIDAAETLDQANWVTFVQGITSRFKANI